MDEPMTLPGVTAVERNRAVQGWRPSVEHEPTLVRRRRGWIVRRLLVLADLLGLVTAFGIAALLSLSESGDGSFGTSGEVLLFLASLPLWILGAKLYGLYNRDEARADHSTVDELVSVFHFITLGVWLSFVAAWLSGIGNPDVPRLATFWLLAIPGIVVCRSGARAVARRQPGYKQRTIIVGAGDVGQLIGRKLLQHPEYGIDLVGFVDAEPRERRGDLGQVQLLGASDELQAIVAENDVERVIFAFSNEPPEQTLDLIRSLGSVDLQIDVVPRLFEAVGPQVAFHSVEGLPLVGLPAPRRTRPALAVKRACDVVGATVALTVLAPTLALIALLIKLDSRGPVFFRQTRLGEGMKEFKVLKFRTMTADADDGPHRAYIKTIMDSKAELPPNGMYKLSRAHEVTRLGRLLRRTSLDELPQLFNVLRGDMSLVGPRPCLRYETEHFAPHHYERFIVPAGMTGLWQVSARAHATFFEALELDVAYARGWSLGLDMRLLLRTPLSLLRVKATG
jgi:exopolysaccharide biosynthesis polyprenyl glycosylphosphotransferase